MTYRLFVKYLSSKYDICEARAIAKIAYKDVLGLSFEQICSGDDERLDYEKRLSIAMVLSRLLKNEPIQYILGKARFFDRDFIVNKNVLIPRPETEDLCRWSIELINEKVSFSNVLDLCTGSGCIAITLACELNNAKVRAIDISDRALSVAQENAKRLGVEVDFIKEDVFNMLPSRVKYDLIVSNPPYICKSEREGMSANVLEYEPEIALFVEDSEPLLFYKSILMYAKENLNVNGWLLFEINPIYANELLGMLKSNGFSNVEIRIDGFGKQRMIGGQLCYID